MSEKLFLGYIIATIGGGILSLELISLELLKVIDENRYKWYEYIGELPIFIAIFITIFTIIYGVKIIITSINEN